MSDNLYEATKSIWASKDCAALSVRWANELEKARGQAENIARFYKSKPLKVFTSLSKARKPQTVFSLRYQGQEVAEIVAEDVPALSIKASHETNNLKGFGLKTPSGKFAWRSPEAAGFRKMFKELKQSKSNPFKMKSDEAWLQSVVFDTMVKSGEAGYHACQPVLFDRFPFQCPLPISANSGIPKASRGNLDVLARRGQGNAHPAIWELKKPKACKKAFEQIYIYGVTLALMLRSEGGDLWYKNMGYSGKLNKDKSLTIDLILALTKDREKELLSHLKTFTEPMELEENIILKPFVAYYEWDKSRDKLVIEEPLELSKYLKKK